MARHEKKGQGREEERRKERKKERKGEERNGKERRKMVFISLLIS